MTALVTPGQSCDRLVHRSVADAPPTLFTGARRNRFQNLFAVRRLERPEVLDAAHGKGKREVEVLVARLRPLPPVPSSVRKLPVVVRTAPAATASSMAPEPPPSDPTPPAPPATGYAAPPSEPRSPRPPVVVPLTPEQYKVQVTVSGETIEKLRRVQDLMRHAIPNGDPAEIFDRALTVLLAQLERTKLAATDRPRKGRELMPWSRHVPADVRRAVWARDDDQCAFVGADGHRCQERAFLELHHTAPYAAGCIASVETIELRCSAHNKYEAELDFGPSGRDRGRTRREANAMAST